MHISSRGNNRPEERPEAISGTVRLPMQIRNDNPWSRVIIYTDMDPVLPGSRNPRMGTMQSQLGHDAGTGPGDLHAAIGASIWRPVCGNGVCYIDAGVCMWVRLHPSRIQRNAPGTSGRCFDLGALFPRLRNPHPRNGSWKKYGPSCFAELGRLEWVDRSIGAFQIDFAPPGWKLG